MPPGSPVGGGRVYPLPAHQIPPDTPISPITRSRDRTYRYALRHRFIAFALIADAMRSLHVGTVDRRATFADWNDLVHLEAHRMTSR